MLFPIIEKQLKEYENWWKKIKIQNFWKMLKYAFSKATEIAGTSLLLYTFSPLLYQKTCFSEQNMILTYDHLKGDNTKSSNLSGTLIRLNIPNSCNYRHNILIILVTLPNFLLTTSKTKHGSKHGIYKLPYKTSYIIWSQAVYPLTLIFVI